ncbi:MAG TPA: hypothetical protein GXZ56_08280 [Bacteroidales bacterium]|jgi:hypothetical protein|nr:hypothetical protein [Bacteroidales bacterium]
MVEVTTWQKITRNPALGLMPLFLFSILVLLVDTPVAVSTALLLSIPSLFVVKRPIRLIHEISLITFAVALPLSFTLFTSLPLLNRFVIVEVIFVLLLVVARLSRGRAMERVVRLRDLTMKNGLRGAFRVAFITRYGLLLHLLLLFALFLFNTEGSLLSHTTFVVIACQVILLLVMLLETTRLHILSKKLCREEWLPVVTEKGDVTGRVAKSITRELKNRFMHPVVRVVLLHDGKIYLKERDASCLLSPGRLDYPFEKYLQFNHAIDETVRDSLGVVCGEGDLPLRFLLKYTFENEATKRLIFLYAAHVTDEEMFNSLPLDGGKLWTLAQIEDNMQSGLFSECFEQEFEYLKNTLFLALQFKHRAGNRLGHRTGKRISSRPGKQTTNPATAR